MEVSTLWHVCVSCHGSRLHSGDTTAPQYPLSQWPSAPVLDPTLRGSEKGQEEHNSSPQATAAFRTSEREKQLFQISLNTLQSVVTD